MRSSISFFLAFVASQAVAQYTNQSAPFNLVLSSSNTTLNGALLGACHEGAAIEGLCLNIGSDAAASYNQYTFNYTTEQTPDPVLGVTGILVRIYIVPGFAEHWGFPSRRVIHEILEQSGSLPLIVPGRCCTFELTICRHMNSAVATSTCRPL
jgi:hypothetical protein